MRSVVRVHLSPLLYIDPGGIAQLGERLPCKQEVTSSNLVISIRGEMNATKAFVALRMYLENCIQIDKNIKTSEVIVITNNN